MKSLNIGDKVKVKADQANAYLYGRVVEKDSSGLVLVRIHDQYLYFSEDDVELDAGLEVTQEISPKLSVTESPPNANEGIKYDAGKPSISLIPVEAILGMAKVFDFGAKKYGRHNFRKGMNHTRVLDAAFRHLLAITTGQDIDPESGQPHWAHALCCLAMYAFYQSNQVGLDDRYKGESNG